jgi:hypothetical protein
LNDQTQNPEAQQKEETGLFLYRLSYSGNYHFCHLHSLHGLSDDPDLLVYQKQCARMEGKLMRSDPELGFAPIPDSRGLEVLPKGDDYPGALR